ncbi:hypothetical protein D1632_16070 [Chryseobacterium nematophagum]|uniref:Cyclic-phosphate processing Receiver domain-containing protein n=1 Tax=Chryseobacterium nematophagum TaxID=2305228 RepID=A0A3M7LAK8_9FLAO|nr:cyclic-phosphate processing receiver domain-containing protein [Chryseobacterium nematophagum]RMZ59075.1 hypothetical protein D1632_16070 [Chryseobacterium nematophagum]
MKKELLFLDDIRYPSEVYKYTRHDLFLSPDWYIVRSYGQFVNRILEKGFPEMISFDHDLGDMNDPVRNSRSEKTGYDCVKWLIEYSLDYELMLPDFYCHSMNPIGKENIIALLTNFRNH